MVKSSIYLKAYDCQDGREIHYAAARLHRNAYGHVSILDVDENHAPCSKMACWILFYPLGPNRRILEAVMNHYSPQFECNKDVLFLCINRPSKGGTSPSRSDATDTNHKPGMTSSASSDERRHVQTTLDDIVTILDFYGISKTSLLYMCAGATFAYSFASKFPERTTGYIIGIASWILRSDSSSSRTYLCTSDDPAENDCDHVDVKTPRMYPLIHRMAMSGLFGPKWMVSHLAGGIVSSVSDIITELMNWIEEDGHDEEFSIFVNRDSKACDLVPLCCNNKEGDAKDIAVCLSTQQDLGLTYKSAVPPQKQVLLWHGDDDKMIFVSGAEYLESMIANATLTRIKCGNHHGPMFSFPEDVMDALNRISSDT